MPTLRGPVNAADSGDSPCICALRALLARSGQTQAGLARRLGVTQPCVSQIMRGDRPIMAHLVRIADALGLVGPERVGFLMEGVLSAIPADLAAELRGADATAAVASIRAVVGEGDGTRAALLRRIASLTRRLGDLAGEVYALAAPAAGPAVGPGAEGAGGAHAAEATPAGAA